MVDSNKHKRVLVDFKDGTSLQFNASSKEDAEAIVDKMDHSKHMAASGSNSPPVVSPTPVTASKSNGHAERDATPSPPAPSAAPPPRFLPPPVRAATNAPSPSPSGKGKARGVRWDEAPPAEISPRQGPLSDEDGSEPEELFFPASEQVKSPSQLQGDGDLAIVLYDFDADGADELTVKEGDRLVVIDREGSDEWWKCKDAKGREGVVPASYLDVSPL